MTDGTRDEFPRDFPIFPQDSTTKLTIIDSDEEAVTVVPETQEKTSSMVC